MKFLSLKRSSSPVRSILAGLFLISLAGCFQYPDGPIFSLQTRDERLGGNWYVDEVTDVNGNNITSTYSNWTLNVSVSKSAQSTFSYFKDGILYSFGTYDFAEHGDQLIIAFTEYQNENVAANIIQKFLDVQRLTDKWFYYIDDQGTEFHWKKF